MARMTRVAGSVHKWLALAMALQILFWLASGLFFAAVPIERVRSEHLIARQPPAPLDLAAAGPALARIGGTAETVELRSLLGRPVALVRAGEAARLVDLASGLTLSPINRALAARIAEADLAGDARAARVTRVGGQSTEYRGALPAWRVDFAGGAQTLYVAADTGAVAARRSGLWRTYDALWALHIMDFENHEDFNTPLLVIASALALVVAISGIILFPSRLGWRFSRARRRATGRPRP